MTRSSDRRQHACLHIDGAVEFVKREPTRRLDGVADLMLDSYSTDDMPCIIKNQDADLEDASPPVHALRSSQLCVSYHVVRSAYLTSIVMGIKYFHFMIVKLKFSTFNN